MPVSPPAAGQVDSELRRSQTQCCDLAPGGCPASCPDAHRPTHGHRHVRNWAITHLSDSDMQRKRFGPDRTRIHMDCDVRPRFGCSSDTNRCASAQPVNGSTLRAARMKLAMMTSPTRKKMD